MGLRRGSTCRQLSTSRTMPVSAPRSRSCRLRPPGGGTPSPASRASAASRASCVYGSQPVRRLAAGLKRHG